MFAKLVAEVFVSVAVSFVWCHLQELGTPSERIWPGYNKLPTVEKVRIPNNRNIIVFECN